MIRLFSKFVSGIFLLPFLFSLVILSFNLDLNALTINQNDKLSERIAKDFSRKFCNGIGFGLSQESAIDFAMKENNQIFKKKKGIENIDNKALAEKMSLFAAENCGFSLNLSEEELASNFENAD